MTVALAWVGALAGGCSALLRPQSGGGGEAAPGGSGARSKASGTRSAAGKGQDVPGCPDLSDQKSLDEADFVRDFAIDDKDARALKTALFTALGVQSLSAKLEADLRSACTGIVKELGGKTDGDGVEAACIAATKAITDARSRLGARTRVNVVYVDPRCAIPGAAISACLGRCASDTPAPAPAAPKIECAASASSGTCEGKCTGTCDVVDGMVCDGRCQGGCDWGFKGTCDGACLGKCNGRKSRGYCKGRCVGQCAGLAVRGTCKGRCQGLCELRHAGSCGGTCSGRCSTPFRALACEAPPKTTAAEPACASRCEPELIAAAQCSLARITVTIDQSKQAARARRLADTLEKYMPTILNIAVGLKGRATGAARTAQIALQAGEDLVNGGAGRGQAGAALSTCASAALRGGLAAIGNLNVSVRVAIEVKAAADAADNVGGHPRG